MRLFGFVLAFAALLFSKPSAADINVTFKAVADTSISEKHTDFSNGKGTVMVAGRTGPTDGPTVRRALFRFDLGNHASCTDESPNGIDDCNVPVGASVLGVSVDVFMQSKGNPSTATYAFSLSRITQTWGEAPAPGSSSPNGGLAAAAAGDATWSHRSWPSATWTAGGSKAGVSQTAAFAPLSVVASQTRTFLDNAGLRSDVSSWINSSSTNFGWMLQGDESGMSQTVALFGTVDSGQPALLHVRYDAPSGSACGAANDCVSGFCLLNVCCQQSACQAGTACRDAESCASGTCSAANKPNGPNAACDDGNVCTSDNCNNGSCDNPTNKAGTTCRNAAGECDAVDTCSNGSSACPDTKKSPGTGCTADSETCTRDICDGSSNSCTHPAGNAGTECRAQSGACDVAETCNGTSTTCPADGVAPSTQECRAPSCQSSSVAILPASCNGASKSCPAQTTESCGALICTANACPGSCTQDTQCASGNYCAAPTCQPKKPNGGSCSAANECTSNFCVDGTCCNSACGGTDTTDCQSCSTGTCTLLTSVCRAASGGCDVAESCSGSSTSCPGDNAASSSTVCRAASCSNGVETVQASCPGGGGKQCPAVVQNSCSPYVCGATACRTSCGSSADCVASHYCSGTACVPRVPRGGACASTSQCQSGLSCADGVCCNSACTGQCQACDINPGTCTTVPSGAPHGSRPACDSDGTVCGGSCNGTVTTSCFYPGASSECIAASCTAGVETLRSVCDASGACNAKKTANCTPFSCGPSSCFGNCSDNVQCEGGRYCLGGNCVPKLDDGESCSNGSQCTSNLCVDGICCDRSCEGQCEACNVAGSEGKCTPVSGTPVGGRPQCVTDGGVCGGVCDGKLRTSCTYLGAGTSCRDESCKNGVATLGAFCNGAGTCPPEVQQECGAVGCNSKSTRCGGDCVVDNDCPPNQVCSAGICRAKGGTGSACARDDECAGGICTDGFCCNSGCQGQCEACDVPGKEGVCSPTTGAPHGTRVPCATDGSTCAGSCNGTQRKQCVYPNAETSCGPAAACSAGIARLPSFCVGSGACPENLSQICSGACSGARCAGGCANDAACGAGQFCSAGVCVDKLSAGQGCSLDSQCAQGFCVEGICCESACNGQCTSCALPGRLGKCVPVLGAPRGGREPCQGEGPCAAQCDGTLNGACVYPQEQVFCGVGACTNGVASGLAVCSGAGSCLAPTKVDCFPYQCDGALCFVACQSDEECQSGFHCDGGSCTPDATAPGEGGAAGAPTMNPGAAGEPPVVAPGEGGSGNGGAPTEMPPTSAGEPNEMPPGAAGMPDGSAGSSGGKDSDGCGCRVPAGRSSSVPLKASVLLGLMLLRRRRTHSRRDAA